MEGNMMDLPLNLHTIFKRNELWSRRMVVSCMDDNTIHRYTYADFQLRVRRLATVLSSLGVKKGDRIATLAYNHYQHLELYFAIPLMGAILHTINFRLFPEQIAYIANHAEDYILFVDGTLAPTIEPLFASGQLSTIKHYVLLGHQRVQTSLKPCAIFNDLVAAAEPIAAFDEMLPENTALGLCYTSGTTGHPKGVLYSHRSTVLAAFSTQMPELYPLSDRDTLLCIVPMFHGHAWGFPFVCAMNGTDIVLPGRDLSPQHLASLLLSERVTFTCGVPTIWLTMYEHLMKEKAKRGGKLDLSHCRIVTSAFVCPDFVFKDYQREFGIYMTQGWGMTEISPCGAIARLQRHHLQQTPDEQLKRRLVQGVPLPTLQMRLMGDNGKPTPCDGQSVGEIQVKGPFVVRRYYKDTTSTSFTEDGWLRTGDVGVWDEERYVRLVDRAKDLIKSGGEWISSVEIENHLLALPVVADAAVIAVPHPRFSERPLALIVLRAGASVPTKAALKEYLEKHVAKWWVPDDFVFVKDLPKTSVGKLDKKAMRVQYEGHVTSKKAAL